MKHLKCIRANNEKVRNQEKQHKIMNEIYALCFTIMLFQLQSDDFAVKIEKSFLASQNDTCIFPRSK
jgi:hypothetical protein